jgi:hypothetical protein
LPNPPCGISGEFVSATVFKFVHGLHQSHVAFLDQIQKLQTAVGIFFGDRDHKAQVCFHQFALGVLRIHVSLRNFPLGARKLFVTDAGFLLQLLQV